MSDIKLTSKDWNIDGAKLGIKPGDKIIFTGRARAEIQFANIKDAIFISEDPLVFTGVNTGGRVVQFSNCQGIRFSGSNAPIEITGGGHGLDFRDLSSDIEVDNIFFHDLSYLAFEAKTDPTSDLKTQRYDAKTNPTGFIMKNIYFHHNQIARTKTGEGTYIGESHYHTTVTVSGKQVKEHEVQGVIIEDNTFEDIGRDAIQVGATTTGCIIRRNKIKNFGMTKEYGQGSGIQLNPGTIGEVYENRIEGGNGFGIIAQGPGLSKIHHNTLIGTGYDVDGGGIMAVVRGTSQGAYEIYNNTLVDIIRVGVQYYCPINVKNNIINVKTGGVIFKKDGSDGTLVDSGNVKLVGDRTSLKLDANFAPTAESTISAGVGIADYVKPAPVVTKEAGTVSIETKDGIDEVFVVGTSGKRIKIK